MWHRIPYAVFHAARIHSTHARVRIPLASRSTFWGMMLNSGRRFVSSDAVSLTQEMPQRKLGPQRTSYHQQLQELADKGEFKLVYQKFDQLKQYDAEFLPISVYRHIFERTIQRGTLSDIQTMLDLLADDRLFSARSLQAIVQYTVLPSLIAHGRSDLLPLAADKLASLRSQPFDVKGYNHVMWKLERRAQYHDALIMFQHMLHHGHKPDANTVMSLIQPAAPWRPPKQGGALALWEEVSKGNIPTLDVQRYNALIGALPGKEAYAALRHMVSCGVAPSHRTYGLLIWSLARDGMVAAVQEAQEEALAKGIRMIPAVGLMLAHANSGQGEKAMEMYAKIPISDIRVRDYVMVFNALATIGQFDRAEQLLHDCFKHKGFIHVEMIKAIVKGLVEQDLARAERLMTNALVAKVEPDNELLTMLVCGHLEAGDVQRAKQYLSRVSQLDVYTCNRVLTSMGKQRLDPSFFIEFFDHMKSKRIPMDVVTFNTALTAFASCYMTPRTETLLQELIDRRLQLVASTQAKLLRMIRRRQDTSNVLSLFLRARKVGYVRPLIIASSVSELLKQSRGSCAINLLQWALDVHALKPSTLLQEIIQNPALLDNSNIITKAVDEVEGQIRTMK